MSSTGAIVSIRIRASARCCLLAALFCVGVAHAQTPAIDDVYLALGQGDMPKALTLSAALVDQAGDNSRHRAEALQARLDVLCAQEDIGKPEGIPLRAAINGYTARHPDARVLAEVFALEAAIEGKKPQDALQQAQALLATRRSDMDVAQLRAVAARAAGLSDGQLPLARSMAEQALVFWSKQNGMRGAWQQVQLHYIIGNVQFYAGDKNEAVREFGVAAQLATERFGADSQTRMKMDNESASALVQLGRNSEALVLREGIFAASRKRYGEHSIQAAFAEAMIGAGLQEIGDYAAGRKRYEHAEQTLADVKDPAPHERGIITANFANLLQEMGEEDAALAHYRQALALWTEEPQATRTRAIVYTNIGNTEYRMHRYDDAVADFQHALALREQADGKDSPGIGYALEGLGSTSLALKRYADAEKYFARALDVRGRRLPPNHPTLAVFNFGLALAHWGQHHNDEAFRYATQTAENQQGMLATFASEFSERQSVAYRDLLVPATALVVTLAAERGDSDSIATAWRLTMVERGLVARAQAQRIAAARSAKDPELAKVWDAWKHANSLLGEAWLGTATTPEHMAQLRSDAEAAERALWLRVGRDPGEATTKVVSIADLAANLPADGVLLAYTEGSEGDLADTLTAGDKSAPDVWFAFVLDHANKPALRRVGTIEALSAQVRAWYRDLRDPGSDPADMRRKGLALRQALLDPFVGAAAQRRLFVVPEGELFRVSFAALPADDHGYLIESGTHVHTLDHESDLTVPAAATSASATLLAGAPNFPQMDKSSTIASRQLCLRATRQGFAAIPNAARELDDLHTLLAGAPGEAKVQVVAGADATKDNVLAALPRANIIHLATHGFSLDGSCEETTTTRGVSLDEAKTGSAAPSNSATLSGLAFSGAELAQGREPVGVLSAGEIGTLDLSHADWVALSACDSGLGPIGRNEGVFGMRRALRLAGARTVVMSLWQVDDAATADLMQTLYRARFAEHRDVPESMTTAMQSVLASRRAAGQSDHPYYWAAFISEGGWR
jgi:CHAT domain-containing protein/tetratricopeptide (TPR) repeat protein